MHSELQVQKLYLTEQRNIFIFFTSIGVLSKGILPAALVPYEGLRKKITTLKMGDKKCSIPYYHSSLLYSLHEKCFFQSTRTVNHNGGASIQWWTNSRCLQSNPPATTNQEHNDGHNSKIRKEIFDRIKARRKLCRNEESGILVLRTQLLILCTKLVALVSAQDQLCLRHYKITR